VPCFIVYSYYYTLKTDYCQALNELFAVEIFNLG